MAHIEALRPQTEETESLELQHLRKEKAALLKASADHRRVLSTIRNLPEDVIRAIFITTVDSHNYPPALSYRTTPLPYKLTQISTGMRHIALATPEIWASMNICINRTFNREQSSKRGYRILAGRASEWFDRAGDMALTVFITDMIYSYGFQDVQSDPSSILFDTLLSYSPRWKSIRVESICQDLSSPPIIRIAALTAFDVPRLQSISLCFQNGISMFYSSPLLSIDTLKHLTLSTDWDDWPEDTTISDFPVNWAVLTSVTIRGGKRDSLCSIDEIARMLQQTKCLVFCDIALGHGSRYNTLGEINLPRLEILCVETGPSSSRSPSIFELINSPILAVLQIHGTVLDTSLADFFARSPGIREFYLNFRLDNERSLADITELLHHCPSLSVLNLAWEWSAVPNIPEIDGFLRTFVEDGGGGVTCPYLQEFRLHGVNKFSLQTLCRFLEAKQPGIDTLSAPSPWKNVVIDMRWIDDSEIRQMQDLVSEKQAAGLDIDVHVRKNN